MTRSILAALVVCVCSSLFTEAQAQQQTATYSYTGSPIPIPIDSADTAAVAEIFVPNPIIVGDVTVRVFIEYPAVGDLEIVLISARGEEVVLLDNDCGNLANVNTTFSDAAPTEFDDFCPVEPGRGPFQPDDELSDIDGELASGYWTLWVVNNRSNSRIGLIREFAVTITGTPVARPSFSSEFVVNSARQDGGVIAPGQLTSIYGVALGPVAGVGATSTPLPTSLGGTTVLINGTAVPLLYSSALQVDLQVPFTVTAGTVANIQIQTAAGTSASVPIEVVSAFAGVFTNQTNGRGLAAALNDDGTRNSLENRAQRGEFVSLFATGLGAVTPEVPAGVAAPANPLSRLSDLVVLIGGATANVSFAGLAPGLVGVYQVNAQVPQNVVSGARGVLLLPSRGYPSQPRTYIWVE
jgi:uncharacterized protein (TIGR03437 family)